MFEYIFLVSLIVFVYKLVTMADLATYIRMAIDMGYGKDKAIEWGTKNYNEAVAREERVQERNQMKLKFEREEREKEMIMEREKLAQRERESARAHALELARLEQQRSAAETPNSGASSSQNNTVNSSLSLPLFKDSEDIASYIKI